MTYIILTSHQRYPKSLTEWHKSRRRPQWKGVDGTSLGRCLDGWGWLHYHSWGFAVKRGKPKHPVSLCFWTLENCKLFGKNCEKIVIEVQALLLYISIFKTVLVIWNRWKCYSGNTVCWLSKVYFYLWFKIMVIHHYSFFSDFNLLSSENIQYRLKTNTLLLTWYRS